MHTQACTYVCALAYTHFSKSKELRITQLNVENEPQFCQSVLLISAFFSVVEKHMK